MLNDKRSVGLGILAVIIFTFIFLSSSFADTIKYSYDNLNRLIRIEYGDGTITDITMMR
jgi:hypothetical protein